MPYLLVCSFTIGVKILAQFSSSSKISAKYFLNANNSQSLTVVTGSLTKSSNPYSFKISLIIFGLTKSLECRICGFYFTFFFSLNFGNTIPAVTNLYRISVKILIISSFFYFGKGFLFYYGFPVAYKFNYGLDKIWSQQNFSRSFKLIVN